MCKRILTNFSSSFLDPYPYLHSIRGYGTRFNKYDKTLYAVIIPNDALFEGL